MGWGEIAGAAISLWSSSKEADALEDRADDQADAINSTAAYNKKISDYDVSVAEKDALEIEVQAGLGLQQHKANVRRIISTQRSSYAASGVAMNVGTPVDVMAHTAAEGAKDAEVIRYNGQTKKERQLSLAARYKLLGEGGLRDAAAQATLIQEAGEYESQAMRIDAISDAVTNAFNYYEEMG